MIENFIEMIVEDIDNAIMTNDGMEDFFDNGGKITFMVDKFGTTTKQKRGGSKNEVITI